MGQPWHCQPYICATWRPRCHFVNEKSFCRLRWGQRSGVYKLLSEGEDLRGQNFMMLFVFCSAVVKIRFISPFSGRSRHPHEQCGWMFEIRRSSWSCEMWTVSSVRMSECALCLLFSCKIDDLKHGGEWVVMWRDFKWRTKAFWKGALVLHYLNRSRKTLFPVLQQYCGFQVSKVLSGKPNVEVTWTLYPFSVDSVNTAASLCSTTLPPPLAVAFKAIQDINVGYGHHYRHTVDHLLAPQVKHNAVSSMQRGRVPSDG